MIILLAITLKYSNLCIFRWFLVKLLLLIKTEQLTVRGLLNRPAPRFSLPEPRHVHDSFRDHTISPFIEQGGMINVIIITIGRSFNIFPAKVTTNKANTT